jgi:hypothetical protein
MAYDSYRRRVGRISIKTKPLREAPSPRSSPSGVKGLVDSLRIGGNPEIYTEKCGAERLWPVCCRGKRPPGLLTGSIPGTEEWRKDVTGYILNECKTCTTRLSDGVKTPGKDKPLNVKGGFQTHPGALIGSRQKVP